MVKNLHVTVPLRLNFLCFTSFCFKFSFCFNMKQIQSKKLPKNIEQLLYYKTILLSNMLQQESNLNAIHIGSGLLKFIYQNCCKTNCAHSYQEFGSGSALLQVLGYSNYKVQNSRQPCFWVCKHTQVLFLADCSFKVSERPSKFAVKVHIVIVLSAQSITAWT